jgi:hypothetical protein
MANHPSGRRSTAWLLLVVLASTLPQQAAAFKAKTHAVTANQAMREAILDLNAVWLRGIPSPVQANNAEVLAAIRAWPAYFRAGALGPDQYPDLIAGQLWVHANRGRSGCLAGGGGDPCVPSGDKLETRSLNRWRSIDYGMYQLRRALQLPANPDRAQALAFSYGYLAHEMADGFAHAWINEWSGDTWVLQEGTGIFGPVTEEVKHVAVEQYLDSRVAVSSADLAVAAPINFLNSLYLGAVTDPTPGVLYRPESAGAFAGVYYEELIKVRDLFDRLSNYRNWATEVGLRNPAGVAALNAALTVQNDLMHVSTLGTDFLNPIADIEAYFGARRTAMQSLLTNWVRLSDCVAQNLLLGSNRAVGAIVATDACQAINFEAITGTVGIFNGELNAAAWYGINEAGFDYGALSHNLQKMGKFVETIARMVVRFSLIEDVKSIRDALNLFGMCNQALIQWGSCNNACTESQRACSRAVEFWYCLPCPHRGNSVWCGGIFDWEFYACSANPVCWGCESNAFEWVTDLVCKASVDAAVPVCQLCTKDGPASVCLAIQAGRDLAKALDDLVAKALQPVVDAIKDEVKRRLLEAYAGPYAYAFVDAFREMERSWKSATPAWIVNIAFLADDLRADPAYLNRLITAFLGVSGNLVSNAAEIPIAVEQTFASTIAIAKPALQVYLTVQSGGTYELVWRGLLTLLYRIARENGFDAVMGAGPGQDPAFAFLDALSVKSRPEVFATRFAKFISLMAELQRVSRIQGPTVLALRAELGLPVATGFDPVTPAAEAVNLHQLHATHNAIEAIKLGFVRPDALNGLINTWAGDAGAGPSAAQQSTICALAPHVACDVVQSLDDPSNIRFLPPADWLTGRDPELSLARWYSNPYRWAGGTVTQNPAACRLTRTDFPLAYTNARIVGLYDRIFRYPPSCPQPLPGCTSLTCAAQGKGCGVVSDQCNGGWVGCGDCPGGQVCMANNTCCAPITSCTNRCGGVIANGCGGTLDCTAAVCPAYYTCGAGNTCTCPTLTSRAAACAGRTCGSASNGCGGTYSCGSCGTGLVCSAGSCIVRPPPPTCFVAGTLVRLVDGSEKPIEEIAVGDRVLSYDEAAGALAEGEVVERFVHADTPALVRINGTLTTTPEHRFYVEGDWVEARDLRIGDLLLPAGLSLDGPVPAARVRVDSLESLPGGVITYNLEVTEHHVYFAGGVLVHNIKPQVP